MKSCGIESIMHRAADTACAIATSIVALVPARTAS
jgi:hypothetical protein